MFNTIITQKMYTVVFLYPIILMVKLLQRGVILAVIANGELIIKGSNTVRLIGVYSFCLVVGLISLHFIIIIIIT